MEEFQFSNCNRWSFMLPLIWAYNKDNVTSAWRYDVKLAARLTFRNLMKMYMVSTQNSSTGICVWHKLLWFGNEYCSLVFKWCWHTLDSWMNAWHKTKKLYNKIPCLHTEQHMNVLLYALCLVKVVDEERVSKVKQSKMFSIWIAQVRRGRRGVRG